MMSSGNHPSDRLRMLLKKAYHEKENLETDSQWQHSAMRRIRTLTLEDSQPGFGFLLGSLAWRMAPVMVVLMVAAGLFLANSGLIYRYDIYEALCYESGNTQLWQMFVL